MTIPVTPALCTGTFHLCFWRPPGMPRRASIHYVSLKSCLVNLPISLYGPLASNQVVRQSVVLWIDCLTHASIAASIIGCPSYPTTSPECYRRIACRDGLCWMDRHGSRVILGVLEYVSRQRPQTGNHRDRSSICSELRL